VIPPRENAAFVAAMEDVLELYALPNDPACPVICLDEMPVQLLSHARDPLPMRPGGDRKEDHEYVREGSVSVFAALDLKGGRRLIQAAERRAKEDFARFVRRVVDEFCAGARKVRLVLDNLSTHALSSLYAAFEPEEARRLARALEFHFTPKHGSWLNAVELEFSAARSQCLARRVASLDELRRELGAWQDERNEKKERVRWTFDVTAARTKLHRIYPTHEP
jgi:transposase